MPDLVEIFIGPAWIWGLVALGAVWLAIGYGYVALRIWIGRKIGRRYESDYDDSRWL